MSKKLLSNNKYKNKRKWHYNFPGLCLDLNGNLKFDLTWSHLLLLYMCSKFWNMVLNVCGIWDNCLQMALYSLGCIRIFMWNIGCQSVKCWSQHSHQNDQSITYAARAAGPGIAVRCLQVRTLILCWTGHWRCVFHILLRPHRYKLWRSLSVVLDRPLLAHPLSKIPPHRHQATCPPGPSG